ncbi:GNAT family N-acetyltransferase [Vibrio algivorus]|uniref:GNAT family N-acetyltransferase n=1 Tax=Vibrio algivorus TaxID=1667024 RepID=A0A557P547_9VIBR|nr:GNAT family N-acetyltransferase [Vibrio algivorus]TVO35792.1 GNAT family N-acetyltransferase [Vibrio algivorus]
MINYKVNVPITSTQFIDLLQQTSLGERRPLDDELTIKGMLENSDLIVTAWEGETLVGIARSITDFYYCCYLSDLAVSENTQTKGIGKQLIIETFKCLKSGCKMNLLAAPLAVEYYPHIGFKQHESAWILSDLSELS